MGWFDCLKETVPLKEGHRWWEGKGGGYQKPKSTKGRGGATGFFQKKPK
ncbi:hypothetical protein [Flavobacterium psychrolimnae]|nr:hypothetical protein [Flavobacterium psychrolimnae]